MPEVVDKIRASNILKVCADLLWKAYSEYHFDVDIKFCDEHSL